MPGNSVVLEAPAQSVGSPRLWIAGVVALLGVLTADFLLARCRHEVSMRAAAGRSVFDLASPLVFGVKLVPHRAHGIRAAAPEIPTPISPAVIVLVLAAVTATSPRSHHRIEETETRS